MQFKSAGFTRNLYIGRFISVSDQISKLTGTSEMNRSESDLISLSIQIQMRFLPQISKVVENGEIGQMRPSEYEGAGLPEPWVIFGSPK